MIWNAGIRLDFDEDELKCFNLLARYADENKIITFEGVDGLKKEMDRESIPTDKLDALVKKMEGYWILQDKGVGRNRLLSLDSLQVQTVQHKLKRVTCPECGKRTLARKVVVYCPDCDYQADER